MQAPKPPRGPRAGPFSRRGFFMRLQSAIFCPEDTLDGHEDAARVLSILKMEGVWLYAVTDLTRAEAAALLDRCGAATCFRGLLTSEETRIPASDPEMLERALRRLRSQKRDTVVFLGRLEALRRAKAAGFRCAAVRGRADDAEWAAMRAEADEVVERYGDFLS